MSGHRLDTPRTIAEVAKIAECAPWRMKRRLLAAHRAHGDVLFRFGDAGKWLTTLALVGRRFPEFARKFATTDEVDDLRVSDQALRRDLNGLAARTRDFQKLSLAWFRKLETRIDALERSNRIEQNRPPGAVTE